MSAVEIRRSSGNEPRGIVDVVDRLCRAPLTAEDREEVERLLHPNQSKPIVEKNGLNIRISDITSERLPLNDKKRFLFF
jgi:hypothetical protein